MRAPEPGDERGAQDGLSLVQISLLQDGFSLLLRSSAEVFCSSLLQLSLLQGCLKSSAALALPLSSSLLQHWHSVSHHPSYLFAIFSMGTRGNDVGSRLLWCVAVIHVLEQAGAGGLLLEA